MLNVSKQSGVRATDSLNDRLHHARVHLTLVYVAILAAILCISSYTIYSSFSGQLQHRFHGRPANQQADLPHPYILSDGTIGTPPTPEEVQSDLVQTLIIVNGLLLILAGIFSYWLAGITLEPIQEAYDRQRRFLSDASHELRTPLTILKTDLENELGDTKTKGAIKERAESHLEEVERMSGLVTDLLSLSRLDEHENRATPKSNWELNATVQEATERLYTIAKQHQVGLHLELDLAKEIKVEVNKELFLQALNNIIKNAILYNRENGTVTVSTGKERNQAKVVVTDMGIGIAKEDLDKIFDRFYRVDKSRSRQSGGSGLGLSIVQSALESLGGSVQISSQIEKGTIVTLLLPLPSSS